MIKWVCGDCGKEHGDRVPELATWHHGKCDICKTQIPVTSARRYGVVETESPHESE